MPFDKQIVSSRGGSPSADDPDAVWVSVVNAAGDKSRTAVTFSFGSNVWKRMHWMPKDKLALSFGSGPDAGMLQFKRSNGSGFALSDPSAAKGRQSSTAKLYCKLSSKYFGSLNVMPIQKMVHEVIGDAVVVVLPNAFRKF